MAHMILVALALVAACAVSAAAPARSESVLVGTLKQCHSVFDCKTTDLQLVRVTGEGVVKKLGIIYRGIPDAQRLSTTVVAAGSAASGIYMVLVTSPVDLNTTAVVLRVAADAQSFSVAASKAVPYINATSISFDESASFAYASTWNGTVFQISLEPAMSLATSSVGALYTQPDVYPLTASPIDSLGLLHAAVFPLLDDPCMHVVTFNTSSGAATQSPCLNGFYDTSGNPPPVTLMAAPQPDHLLVLSDNVAGPSVGLLDYSDGSFSFYITTSEMGALSFWGPDLCSWDVGNTRLHCLFNTALASSASLAAPPFLAAHSTATSATDATWVVSSITFAAGAAKLVSSSAVIDDPPRAIVFWTYQ